MKPTLYEALGLSRTASEAEVKGALRRLVRRYYTSTRAGHHDVEEALRFLNHASHILGNAARRAEYDANLAETAHAASSMTTIGGAFEAHLVPPGDTEPGESLSQAETPRDRPPPPPPELAPELSARLADIRRTRAGQLSALLAAIVVLAATWVMAVPSGEALSLVGFTVAMLAVAGVVAVVAAGIVHLLSRSLWRLPAPENALSLVEGMIPRWRKDRTVFLGTGAPVEDATWLFRLRMAELKRVKAERVSDPRPTMRLFARLFDYAVWGVAYAMTIAALTRANVMPVWLADLAVNPLIAPFAVSLTWIPIEALLLAQLQTTPGRWLLCVYVQQGVSNPYAPEELRFTFRTAAGRAFEVWWRGCAAWLPLVSLVAVARARELVQRSGETRWDSRRDCLVTHGPVGRLAFVTLALGLLAGALTYAAHWRDPVRSIVSDASRALATARTPAAQPTRSTTPLAPIVSLPQARISRLDDAPVEPVPVAPQETGPVAGRDTVEDAAATAPAGERSSSVASNRTMAVENAQPSNAAPANASRSTAVAAPATAPPAAAPAATAPPVTAPRVTAPPAAAPPAAAPPVTAPPVTAPPVTAPPPAAPPATDDPTAAPSSFSPKTFFANLFRKSQPVEPPAPAPQPPQEAEKGPSPREVRERRVTEFLRQAQRQQTAGDHAGLVRTCTRWSEEDSRNPRAFYCLGLGQQGTGQHKEAIKTFNKAGSLLPRNDPMRPLIDDAVVRSFRAQTGQ